MTLFSCKYLIDVEKHVAARQLWRLPCGNRVDAHTPDDEHPSRPPEYVRTTSK